MSLKTNVRIDLNEPKIENKATNDNFGLVAATEWKKLINPYTPRDTGRTEETAVISPWTIVYNPVDPITKQHYAQSIYYGMYMRFQKTHNPYATFCWDKAAEQAGKKTDLYRKLNSYLHG